MNSLILMSQSTVLKSIATIFLAQDSGDYAMRTMPVAVS